MEIAEQLIATRIREARRTRKMTLEKVAAKTGLSKGFLSRVEGCKVSISIAALSRLASALGVPLGEFFDTEEANADIVFVPRGSGGEVRGEAPKLPYNYEVLVPRRGARQMQPVMISIYGRHTKFELRRHPGEQFIYMMEGELDYVCGNEDFTLHPGDCLYFNARIPHGPKAKRNQKARYLAVFTSSTGSTHGQLKDFQDES